MFKILFLKLVMNAINHSQMFKNYYLNVKNYHIIIFFRNTINFITVVFINLIDYNAF